MITASHFIHFNTRVLKL